MYREDRTQNCDPGRTSYRLHHPLCHIVIYKMYSQTHKSRLRYEVKYDLYKTVLPPQKKSKNL